MIILYLSVFFYLSPSSQKNAHKGGILTWANCLKKKIPQNPPIGGILSSLGHLKKKSLLLEVVGQKQALKILHSGGILAEILQREGFLHRFPFSSVAEQDKVDEVPELNTDVVEISLREVESCTSVP